MARSGSSSSAQSVRPGWFDMLADVCVCCGMGVVAVSSSGLAVASLSKSLANESGVARAPTCSQSFLPTWAISNTRLHVLCILYQVHIRFRDCLLALSSSRMIGQIMSAEMSWRSIYFPQYLYCSCVLRLSHASAEGIECLGAAPSLRLIPWT